MAHCADIFGDSMILYDISPVLHSGVAVWPGDVAFERTQSLSLSRHDAVNLSSIRMSLHTGAHVDAPGHFSAGADCIDTVDLEPFLGPARVAGLPVGGAIQSADLDIALEGRPERLLLRLDPAKDPDRFPASFAYFSSAAAEAVGRAGIRLIGIDSPSVDPFDSSDLPAHHIFHRFRVAILENIDLGGVPDGDYELIALPLKIRGGDGSPVRAVLRARSSAR